MNRKIMEEHMKCELLYGESITMQSIPVKNLHYTIHCIYYPNDYKIIWRETDNGELITREEAERRYEEAKRTCHI
jgi:hypothetical protein